MEFPTKYNSAKRNLPTSVTGERKKALYQYNGNHELVPNGKFEDTQDMINSYAEECDINNLIKRFTLGDFDALNQVRGFYADVTKFPTSYSELYEKVEECKRMFESLKPEIREEFNNNPAEFFDTYGSEQFVARISKYNIDLKVPVDGVKEDVVVDAPKGGVINEF